MPISDIYIYALRHLEGFDEEAIETAISLAKYDVVEDNEDFIDFVNFNIEDRKFPNITKPFKIHDIEKAVDIAVFVAGQTHIINVHIGIIGLVKQDGERTEAEIVDAVFAFRYGKEGFSVISFDPDDHADFSIHFNRTGVESGIDSEPFHEERITFGVKIITPFQRDVFCGNNGVDITFKTSVVPLGIDLIGTGYKFFIAANCPLLQLFKITHFFLLGL